MVLYQVNNIEFGGEAVAEVIWNYEEQRIALGVNVERWTMNFGHSQHLDTGKRRSSREDQERVASEAGGKARDLDIPET